MTYVYMIQAGYGGIKIGVSNNPEKRLKELQTSNHKPLHIVVKFPFKNTNDAYIFEKFLHERFAKYQMRGEWFKRCILRMFPNRSRVFPNIFDGGKIRNYMDKEAPVINLTEGEVKGLIHALRKQKRSMKDKAELSE